MHETAHAFVDEITQGTAPRAFNEGLAKFLEREVTHGRQDLTATAQLELEERHGRELAAVLLARALEEFRTEDLGQASTVFTTYVGGELSKAIASTKSVDAAFEATYGRGYDGTRRAWLDWLRGRWASSLRARMCGPRSGSCRSVGW